MKIVYLLLIATFVSCSGHSPKKSKSSLASVDEHHEKYFVHYKVPGLNRVPINEVIKELGSECKKFIGSDKIIYGPLLDLIGLYGTKNKDQKASGADAICYYSLQE